MSENWLKYTLFFVAIGLLQIWILNRVHLFGFATPLFYVYFILKLPADMGRNSLLFIAALLGLIIDCFSYTFGINMLACTIMGFSRHYALNYFAPRDTAGSFVPSVETFGLPLFIRYLAVLIIIHHTVLFVIESFSFFNLSTLMLRIVGSFILTSLLIFGTEQFKIDFLKK